VIGKVLVLSFWMLTIYVFAVPELGEWATLVKWTALVVVDLHIFEALWFLWWKGSDEVPILSNVFSIILFGFFHLIPLYRAFMLKEPILKQKEGQPTP